MSLMALVVVLSLENLMTNPDFRIIGVVDITNIYFGNLVAKVGGCEMNSGRVYRLGL